MTKSDFRANETQQSIDRRADALLSQMTIERIMLAPGQKRTVRFMLGKPELTYWSGTVKE